MDSNENKISNTEESVSPPINNQEEAQHPKRLKEIILTLS
jgi:hypothetical protein